MAPAVLLRAAVALTGRFPALAGVDLGSTPGEVLVLAGPNGAGKTCVLRVCAGLLRLIRGESAVLGHDLVEERRPCARWWRCLGHAASALRRPERARERPLRGAGRRRLGGGGARGARAPRPWRSAVADPGRPALRRPATPGRTRGRARRRPAFGCSTSRTPLSTPRDGDSSPLWSPRRWPPGRARSGGLARAGRGAALADGVVTMAGGRVHEQSPAVGVDEWSRRGIHVA